MRRLGKLPAWAPRPHLRLHAAATGHLQSAAAPQVPYYPQPQPYVNNGQYYGGWRPPHAPQFPPYPGAQVRRPQLVQAEWLREGRLLKGSAARTILLRMPA